jgi:hypothetical protein
MSNNRRNFLKSLTLGATVLPLIKHATFDEESIKSISKIHVEQKTNTLQEQYSTDLLPAGIYLCICSNVNEIRLNSQSGNEWVNGITITWSVLSVITPSNQIMEYKQEHTITQYLSLGTKNFPYVRQFCNSFNLVHPGDVMIDFNLLKGITANIFITVETFKDSNGNDVLYNKITAVKPA